MTYSPLEYFAQVDISYFQSMKGNPTHIVNVERVLNGISSDAFKSEILRIRMLKATDSLAAKSLKSSLPAVTFCGTFQNKRNIEGCTNYTELLVIDIDHIDNLETARIYSNLLSDTYIASFWKSPSGDGYKGLVRLEFGGSLDSADIQYKHRIAFKKLYMYLLAQYGIELDKSGSDISRLCFMSWDPHLIIKEVAETFFVSDGDIIVDGQDKHTKPVSEHKQVPIKPLGWNNLIGENRKYPENSYYRHKLMELYKKLLKKNISITDSYENWVKVAFAISSSIHPVKGRELFLKFCRLDGAYHDEQKSERLIFDAYLKNSGKVGFQTIIYLAREKGVKSDR